MGGSNGLATERLPKATGPLSSRWLRGCRGSCAPTNGKTRPTRGSEKAHRRAGGVPAQSVDLPHVPKLLGADYPALLPRDAEAVKHSTVKGVYLSIKKTLDQYAIRVRP